MSPSFNIFEKIIAYKKLTFKPLLIENPQIDNKI